MKKEELKKLLKPMIKECIKEVIFEDGILSNIVSEVAQGLGGATLLEAHKPDTPSSEGDIDRDALLEERRRRTQQQRKKLLSAINTDAYGGVNVFEGVEPLSSAGHSSQTSTQGPLSNVNPDDPGVDISGLVGVAGRRWSEHMK